MIVPDWLPAQQDKEVQYTLSLVNGVYQMHKQEEQATNDLINDFETRDDDVFVCTYVKSGTTWTQQIISLLLNKGDQSTKNYTEVVPWLESLTFSGAKDKPAASQHEAQNWTLDLLRSTPQRRFMKSHANLKGLPVGAAKGLKVIYVARNPKDVCVSLLHHVLNKQGNAFGGDFSDMLACFVKGKCENGSWFNHVLEWWEAAQADPEHVMFLCYEDMLADPQAHIQKIADFTGIDCTPEILAKTLAGSTISAMRTNPKANIRPFENHLRKGGSGGWRDVFTVRESEAFDKLYHEQMAGSGLKMDFGEGLVM